jgi:large subunit ribosomal protein L7/L12
MSEEAQNEGQTEEVVVPEKFQKLVSEIAGLSVLDLSELVKILEKKFGVSAAAPVMMAGAAGAGDTSAGEEAEKDSFDVELTEGGPSKIAVIKVVREVTGKGLKEAKDMVDAAPKVIAEGKKKEEAEELKKKLEEAGATVVLK